MQKPARPSTFRKEWHLVASLRLRLCAALGSVKPSESRLGSSGCGVLRLGVGPCQRQMREGGRPCCLPLWRRSRYPSALAHHCSSPAEAAAFSILTNLARIDLTRPARPARPPLRSRGLRSKATVGAAACAPGGAAPTSPIGHAKRHAKRRTRPRGPSPACKPRIPPLSLRDLWFRL